MRTRKDASDRREMKLCLQCEQENEDDARFCQRCRHDGFISVETPTSTEQPELGSPPAKPTLEYLTTERAGNLVVLKCRTPEEAILVAGELEAADILAIL